MGNELLVVITLHGEDTVWIERTMTREQYEFLISIENQINKTKANNRYAPSIEITIVEVVN